MLLLVSLKLAVLSHCNFKSIYRKIESILFMISIFEEADLEESPPRDLDKAGVYGFVTYDDSGESVLANNPDLRYD